MSAGGTAHGANGPAHRITVAPGLALLSYAEPGPAPVHDPVRPTRVLVTLNVPAGNTTGLPVSIAFAIAAVSSAAPSPFAP